MARTEGRPSLASISALDDPLLSCNYRVIFTKLPQGVASRIASMANTFLNNIVGTGRTWFFGLISRPTAFETDKVQALGLRCKSGSIAAQTIETITIEHKGFKIVYPGRRTQENTVTLEFIEDQELNVMTIILYWMENVRSQQQSSSAAKYGSITGYSGTMQLLTFKQDGTFGNSYTYENIYPISISEIQFSGSNAEIVTISATFAYDMCHFDKEWQTTVWKAFN